MTKFRGGLPALRWLAKHDADAALAVWHAIRDAECAYVDCSPRQDSRDANADDAETHIIPDVPLTSETMAEPTRDGPDETWPEMLHEIRPSVDDMLSSIGWIEWPWCGQRDRKGRYKRTEPLGYVMRAPSGRVVPADGATLEPDIDGDTITLGGLTFYVRPATRRGREGGLLVSYVDSDGRPRKPSYRAAKPRGGKRPLRTVAAAAEYLDLKPTPPSPMAAEGLRRPLSEEPALMPLYTPLLRKKPDALDSRGRFGVEEGRALLRRLEEAGGLPPVTICPPAIARGARFMGGLVAANGVAIPPAPNWEPREVKPLPAVLEEVGARGTLADIGVRLGYRGGYADRAGGKALLKAGRALVAANDNAERKIAA